MGFGDLENNCPMNLIFIFTKNCVYTFISHTIHQLWNMPFLKNVVQTNSDYKSVIIKEQTTLSAAIR